MTEQDYKMLKKSLRCHWLYSLKDDIRQFWQHIQYGEVTEASNTIHLAHMGLNIRYGDRIADRFVNGFFKKCFKLCDDWRESASPKNRMHALTLSFACLDFLRNYCTLKDGVYVIN